MAEHELLQGPTGYENWVAAARGAPSSSAFELQLYSDAHLTDEVVTGAGPYSFYNALPAMAIGTFTHVLTLRVEVHVAASSLDLSHTDTSRYHGGWLADEISSLAGLLLGVRLRAGRVSREFRGDDSRGRPWADTDTPASPLPRLHRGWIVPRAHGTNNIRMALLPLFATYHQLSPTQAVTLVRAARLYQDAMWVVESEPELAWLLLVSAVEVVATQYQVATQQPEEILRLSLPNLHAAIDRAGGAELLSECAGHLSRLLRATQRFLSFIQQFLPHEPQRPAQNVVPISWEWPSLRKALSQVYDYRSRALHDGIPFPMPMCNPPMLGGFHHERPSGLAAGTNEAAWISGDLPMLLHVFEHIARGAILNWWRSLVALGVSPTSVSADDRQPGQSEVAGTQQAAQHRLAGDGE